MNLPLLAIGIAVVVFGAVVLLRFADRPGGTVKWLGLELSSKGAGLPLIALGVLCSVLALQSGSSSPSSSDEGRETSSVRNPPETSAVTRPRDASGMSGFPEECLMKIAPSVPDRRIATIEAGMSDAVVVDSSQPQSEPFVLILTENGTAVAALRVRKYEGSSSSSTLFKLESVVDAECNELDQLANVSRGGDPRSLMNWDTVRLRLGERRYDLRIGGEGDIGVNYFRVAN